MRGALVAIAVPVVSLGLCVPAASADDPIVTQPDPVWAFCVPPQICPPTTHPLNFEQVRAEHVLRARVRRLEFGE
jgi:hypothetical protein